MGSQELRDTIELMRSQASIAAEGLTLEERRAMMEEQQAQLPVPSDLEREAIDMDGVAGLRVSAPNARPDRFILYFHGGGYVMGSVATHVELMGRLSRACSATVYGVDYRLAPEAPHPAAVEDGLCAFRWLVAHGAAPERIMIGGDSAGGGLTLATLLSLKSTSDPMPAGAILFSPWTDLACTGESMSTRAGKDPMITDRGVVLEMAKTYTAGHDLDAPLVSPLYADLTALPPLLIQAGDAELLLDDSTRLAERAEKAGTPVRLTVWDEAYHVFQANPYLPETREAIDQVAAFFREQID
jgi:monoterpene epsilon-lactone hydrolase